MLGVLVVLVMLVVANLVGGIVAATRRKGVEDSLERWEGRRFGWVGVVVGVKGWEGLPSPPSIAEFLLGVE